MKFGGTAAASFTVNSATQITAVTAAGIGAVTVSVTTIERHRDVGRHVHLRRPRRPITGLRRRPALKTGGTSVVITGTGFTGATAVKFGGTAAASYVVNSATQITAVTAAGTGAVCRQCHNGEWHWHLSRVTFGADRDALTGPYVRWHHSSSPAPTSPARRR